MKRIENSIELSKKYADYIIEELSKIPPNWGQVYEYMGMIGGNITDTVGAIYDITKEEELREKMLSSFEQEHKKIKENIVNKIKEVCKK